MRRIFAGVRHIRKGQDLMFANTPGARSRGAGRPGRALSPWIAAGVSAFALALGSFALAAPGASAGTIFLPPWDGVSLHANNATLPVGNSATLTATVSPSVSVTSTGYAIEIFDLATHARIARCTTGTSCSTTVSHSTAGTYRYKAFIAAGTTGYPPSGIQDESPASFVTWSNADLGVSLSVPSSVLSPGASVKATATANENVGATPYWISIWNETGTRLAQCSSGTSCSATFTPPYGTTNIVAFVSGSPTVLPPSGIVASSNTHSVYEAAPIQ